MSEDERARRRAKLEELRKKRRGGPAAGGGAGAGGGLGAGGGQGGERGQVLRQLLARRQQGGAGAGLGGGGLGGGGQGGGRRFGNAGHAAGGADADKFPLLKRLRERRAAQGGGGAPAAGEGGGRAELIRRLRERRGMQGAPTGDAAEGDERERLERRLERMEKLLHQTQARLDELRSDETGADASSPGPNGEARLKGDGPGET